MKKILLMLSLIVIGLFLVSCAPQNGSENTALAGEAVKVQKQTKAVEVASKLKDIKLCGKGYTWVPGAPLCKSYGLSSGSVLKINALTDNSMKVAWVTFDCAPKKVTEKIGNCPIGTETLSYETHYVCKKNIPFKFEGCLGDYQLEADYSNTKTLGGDYFVICRNLKTYSTTTEIGGLKYYKLGDPKICGDEQASVLYRIPMYANDPLNMNLEDYGKHCCGYETTIVPPSGYDFCLPPTTGLPTFGAVFTNCASVMTANYLCSSNSVEPSNLQMSTILASENACGNSKLFTPKAIDKNSYCCVSK